MAKETASPRWSPYRVGASRLRLVAAACAALFPFGACAGPSPPHAETLQAILDLQDRRDAGSGRLQAWLEHHDPRVRAFAARGLAVVSEPGAEPALARALLRDPDHSVRAYAALALARLGRGAAALAHALQNDASASVRRVAAAGAINLPATADAVLADALRVALHDDDPSVRSCAAFAVVRRPRAADGRDAARAVLEALRRETDAGTRADFVSALAETGDPAAVRVLTDLAVLPPQSPAGLRIATRAMRGLATLAPARAQPGTSFAAPSPLDVALQDANPAIRATLRRSVRSRMPALASAAAEAIAAAWPFDLAERTADARALIDAVVSGGALEAVPATALAAATLQRLCFPARSAGSRALARALEEGTAAANVHARAACLEAFAQLEGTQALRAVRLGLGANDARVRAGAARGLAYLPQLHRDVQEAIALALYDRDPRVVAATLGALAQRGETPLRVLASVDPELLLALADMLRPPFDSSLVPRLFGHVLAKEGAPLPRALAVRAATLLTDAEDHGIRSLLQAISADGDAWIRLAVGDARTPAWPESSAPRLGAEFEWRWLHVPPRVDVRTTAGVFHIETLPDVAPVHVFHLLQRIAAGAGVPTRVAAVTSSEVRLGHPGLRPALEHVLRTEPGVADFSRPGLVGFVPLPLPELDGVDLFVTKEARPDWALTRTIVGRIVDGMDVVERVQPGDRILDIRVAADRK